MNPLENNIVADGNRFATDSNYEFYFHVAIQLMMYFLYKITNSLSTQFKDINKKNQPVSLRHTRVVKMLPLLLTRKY